MLGVLGLNFRAQGSGLIALVLRSVSGMSLGELRESCVWFDEIMESLCKIEGDLSLGREDFGSSVTPKAFKRNDLVAKTGLCRFAGWFKCFWRPTNHGHRI